MKGLSATYKTLGSVLRARFEDPHAGAETKDRLAESQENAVDPAMIEQTVSDWLAGGAQYARPGSQINLDRVLQMAKEQSFFTASDVRKWNRTLDSNDGTLSWRDVATMDPHRRLPLERLAAKIYGFRPVLVCQMSSLILADLLSVRVSPTGWEKMFEMGVAPVVEHGSAPLVNGRIVCISRDPSNRNVRAYLNQITEFRAELAYADAMVVSGVLDLMAQQVPAIGAAVYVSRSSLKMVKSSIVQTKRAA